MPSLLPRIKCRINSGRNPDVVPAPVALGHLGGLKGGKARAEKLSKKKRSEFARKAAAR